MVTRLLHSYWAWWRAYSLHTHHDEHSHAVSTSALLLLPRMCMSMCIRCVRARVWSLLFLFLRDRFGCLDIAHAFRMYFGCVIARLATQTQHSTSHHITQHITSHPHHTCLGLNISIHGRSADRARAYNTSMLGDDVRSVCPDPSHTHPHPHMYTCTRTRTRTRTHMHTHIHIHTCTCTPTNHTTPHAYVYMMRYTYSHIMYTCHVSHTCTRTRTRTCTCDMYDDNSTHRICCVSLPYTRDTHVHPSASFTSMQHATYTHHTSHIIHHTSYITHTHTHSHTHTHRLPPRSERRRKNRIWTVLLV